MKHTIVKGVSQELVAQGLLIEAGFAGMCRMAYDGALPADQIAQLRQAFFAGAHHVFASVMAILDPGEEPTEADMQRMSKINDELERFIKEFEAKHMATKGSA